MKERATPDEAKCPVDDRTREAWVQQARGAKEASAGQNGARMPARQEAGSGSTTPSMAHSWWTSWLSWASRRNMPSSSSSSSDPPRPSQTELATSRVTSSIPRSPNATTVGPSAQPSNHEQETGASTSGHWVYPSEKMFFEAMRRKGFSGAAAADMKTVVPIHNAVNERAWAEILEWERPYAMPSCGGPRLLSFAGLGDAKAIMTPRARINTLLGYTAPFDRHDWVVDRCGTRVEYVIDFYAGRPDAKGAGKLSFYLDVRPKLNTWEGVKMRALRLTGLA